MLVKIYNIFCWILSQFFSYSFPTWNPWKRIKMNRKGWTGLQKSSSTSFRVHAASKSWSKYTTLDSHAFKETSAQWLDCNINNKKIVFGLCSTQMLVEIYNRRRWKIFLCFSFHFRCDCGISIFKKKISFLFSLQFECSNVFTGSVMHWHRQIFLEWQPWHFYAETLFPPKYRTIEM